MENATPKTSDVTMTKTETDDTELSPAQKAEKEKADADFETTLDGLSDDEKEVKRGEREALLLDKEYEAEEQAEQERKRLAKEAHDERERKRRERGGGQGDGSGDGKPVTADNLREVVSEVLNERDANSLDARALEVARKHTTSEAAARAAVTFYKNRVQPTGNLEDDILFAIGGMERKRSAGKNAELGRALGAKDRVGNDAVETQRDGDGGGKTPKLPENSPLKSYTFIGKGIYSKKLTSGKTLFVNTKAMPGQRSRWTE